MNLNDIAKLQAKLERDRAENERQIQMAKDREALINTFVTITVAHHNFLTMACLAGAANER